MPACKGQALIKKRQEIMLQVYRTLVRPHLVLYAVLAAQLQEAHRGSGEGAEDV